MTRLRAGRRHPTRASSSATVTRTAFATRNLVVGLTIPNVWRAHSCQPAGEVFLRNMEGAGHGHHPERPCARRLVGNWHLVTSLVCGQPKPEQLPQPSVTVTRAQSALGPESPSSYCLRRPHSCPDGDVG